MSSTTHSTFASELAERLAEPGRGIDAWRLVVDAGTSTEVGLKDNHPGGPYDAPNSVSGTRGEVYLRWSDGTVSSGTVDLTTLENLDEDLALWRTAAFVDEFAAEVLGPQDVPSVPLYDAAVAEVVHTRHAPLFELLERVRRELPPYDAERVSASVTAATNRRHLITSAGLEHQSQGTSFGAYADADHRAHDFLSLRTLPTVDEVGRMIRRAGETNRLLRQEAELVPGRQPVLLTPSATEAMLNKFLMTNLDGQRVLSGSSAFHLAQFAEGAPFFHPAFGLAVDPLVPMSPGSYELTREGVPARRQAFIEGGRLVTPLLDLKHARKAQLPATPFPRGGSSLRLAGPTRPFDELVAAMDHGFVVYGLLGLHTQDGTRGNFSVTVAQGLVVRNGRTLGRAKAIIAGNFFDALRQDFQLGSQEGRDVPGLQIQADVTPG
ncbi:MAG: putative Zn-dependent protease-like protein [Cyanobacteria bacterium RYN_339]|nr:putative Zn-dependent protease-like protein [Cyanobacteria bacterium RYN_339]